MHMDIKEIKKIIGRKYEEEEPKEISYHGFHHVLAVLKSCNEHIERLNINPKDAHLLRVAALLHDVGILSSYDDHEAESIKFAKKNLPVWGYGKEDIKKICEMILATKLPQEPKNVLDEIICDADLDYLGKRKFYEIGETLFEEFKAYGVVSNEEQWDQLQIRFLEKHKYHTGFAKKYRQPKKQKRISEIKEKWGW
jgi:uncharacterized protein